jgi:hypothetical protein
MASSRLSSLSQRMTEQQIQKWGMEKISKSYTWQVQKPELTAVIYDRLLKILRRIAIKFCTDLFSREWQTLN